MTCDPLVYSDVDALKWACARDVVNTEYGITIDSDRGEASKKGFTLRWIYDTNEKSLEIQCSSKPFLVPCGMVNDRINAAAEKCGVMAREQP